MKTLIVAILLAGSLSLGCGRAARRGNGFEVSTSGQDEIYRFVQTYLEAANHSDVEALSSVVLNSPLATSVANGEMTKGWDAIKKKSLEINDTGLYLRVSLRGVPQQYQLASDALLVVAPYVLTVANTERSVELSAITTLILVKQGDSWKILHEHNSAIPQQANRGNGD